MIKQIVRAEIGLTEVNPYVEGEHEEIIKKGLRKAGLLSNRFLYSFFDHGDLDMVLQSGTTRDEEDNIIYAFRRDQLVWESERPNCSIKVRIKEDLDPCIAVLDARYLEPALIADSSFGYSFKDPSQKTEALIGIARLLM